MKKIIIKNSSGEKLAGVLHESKTNKLVIVCHGRACTKDEHFYPELCERLAKNNFNAFRFDFSGNGESEGKFEDSTITKDIEDIKYVVDYFKKRNYEVFSLIGHSQGAVEVLLHQSKYNSAKCVVDIAAYADQRDATIKKYPKEKIDVMNQNGFIKLSAWGKTFKLTKKYFYDRAEYGDIRTKAGKIKARVLVIHGTEDKDISFTNSKKIISALNKESKLVSVKGADHFFESSTYRNSLINSIVAWLKRQS